MKSYLALRPLASFIIAVFIGAYSTSMLVQGEERVYVRNGGEEIALSPELYNSAFSPTGNRGGEIVPASCSIGYPSDASDGFAPCPVPSVTITPSNSVNLTGGGYFSWAFNSDNAAFCDFSTTMSAPGLGPNYYYVTDPDKVYNNFGPFVNQTGWVRYTVQCWDTNRTVSDTESITFNLTRTPEVNLLFGGSTSPFLAINSFTSSGGGFSSSATLSWNVSGATSCSATGPSGWAGSTITLPAGSRTVSRNSSYSITRSYTLTCTNGTDTVIRSQTVDFEVEPTCGSYGCVEM